MYHIYKPLHLSNLSMLLHACCLPLVLDLLWASWIYTATYFFISPSIPTALQKFTPMSVFISPSPLQDKQDGFILHCFAMCTLYSQVDWKQWSLIFCSDVYSAPQARKEDMMEMRAASCSFRFQMHRLFYALFGYVKHHQVHFHVHRNSTRTLNH